MNRQGFLRSFLVVTALAVTTLSFGADKEKIQVAGWPAADKAFAAIIPEFNKKYPNIEVVVTMMQTGDHHNMLATALAAGSGAPDVAMIEQAAIGRYKDSGGFENLLDAPYSIGTMKKDFVQYKWDLATSVDGKKTIGLVWDIGPATIFYRQDVFKSVGLPSDPAAVEKLMSTWDGVLKVAKAVYIPNKRWLLPNAYYLYTWNYMNRDFYNEKLELNLDKPGTKEALEAAVTMRKNGWDAKLPSMWENEAYAGLGNGSIVMVAAGSWYGGFLKSWIAPKTSGMWGVARLPGKIADSNWGGSYLSIPSQSKHKDAAWKFIQFALATKEAQNKMFETVDYFPGYIPSWGDKMYTEGDPYFGGQKTKSLWVDISKSIKPTFSTLMDTETENTLNSTVNTGINQGLPAAQIIANAKKAILDATVEDRDKMTEILKAAGKWKN